MKNLTTDMTTGNTVKHIILFALPALIGNVFQQLYNLADSIIVGRFVGSDALAAVGATGSITFLFFALCNGIGSGGGVIASQYYGAHDDENVKKTIVNTGIIMLIVPAIFGTIGFISAPSILELLGTPEAILPSSAAYIRFMSIGLVFVSLYNYITSMLRALGDSKSPLYFLILSAIINVALDIILVYFFGMGINGAAIATVISQFIAAFACIVYAYRINPYFRLEKKDIIFVPNLAYKIVRLGVPMSLQFALIAISAMVVQRIVNSYGTVVVAAFTATSRIEQLIHQPYITLSTSIATFSGQNYGAAKYDRVNDGYKKGLGIMVAFTVIMVAVMQLFGGAITSLFVSDAEVIELGSNGLKITSIFYIALGLIYVVRGVLNGIGDAFFALFNGIVEVIGRLTIPILITSYMGMGAPGIWLATGIVWVLSGVTAWIRLFTHFSLKHFNIHLPGLFKNTQAVSKL
ncbi:MAG: MATE family efflux transporter [Butyrivibrio sp.]|jgi:putative MATE family efflux protein|nr:MATE family efflux transporter [Butyrivibrio sp.]